MGAWYIDRSRNLSEETKWIKSLIFTINRIDPENAGLDSKKLIDLLPEELKLGKNPHAILTYLRDIGFLDLDNRLGSNSLLLTKNQLMYWELIFELLFKRFYSKDEQINIQPFIIICAAMYGLYIKSGKANDCFLTWFECSEFLFPVKSYNDFDDVVISSIFRSRKKPQPRVDSKAVLDIWFNSLKKLPIFLDDSEKDVLHANPDYLDFFELLFIVAKSATDETLFGRQPISRSSLYQYYGSDSNGIMRLIPEIKFDETITQALSDEEIYSLLFNPISQSQTIDHDPYQNFASVFYVFRWCPRIPLRKLSQHNPSLASRLISISLKDDLEKRENELFQNISSYFNKQKQYHISKEEFDKHINSLVSFELFEPNLIFKKSVTDIFEGRCAICNEKTEELGLVCRIKEFSDSFNLKETFDLNNGLLLCPVHSVLFQNGFISINTAGIIQVHDEDRSKLINWKLHDFQSINSIHLTIQRRKYFGYHHLYKFHKRGKQ